MTAQTDSSPRHELCAKPHDHGPHTFRADIDGMIQIVTCAGDIPAQPDSTPTVDDGPTTEQELRATAVMAAARTYAAMSLNTDVIDDAVGDVVAIAEELLAWIADGVRPDADLDRGSSL